MFLREGAGGGSFHLCLGGVWVRGDGSGGSGVLVVAVSFLFMVFLFPFSVALPVFAVSVCLKSPLSVWSPWLVSPRVLKQTSVGLPAVGPPCCWSYLLLVLSAVPVLAVVSRFSLVVIPGSHPWTLDPRFPGSPLVVIPGLHP